MTYKQRLRLAVGFTIINVLMIIGIVSVYDQILTSSMPKFISQIVTHETSRH